MKFDPVSKKADKSVHQQLREQIIYRISTGDLKPGDTMSSVRAAARQLGISFNTVGSVYSELVEEKWLFKRRGREHIVLEQSIPDLPRFADLEGLVNLTVDLALRNGYSLQHLSARLQERLQDRPPDHLLIIEPVPELGELMRQEIRQFAGLDLASCSVTALKQDPSKLNGAVLLTPIALQKLVESIQSQARHIVKLTYSRPDEHAARIRNLPHPSAVGMASISPAAIETARSYLAPACGDRHSSREFHMEWPVGKEGLRFKPFSKYQRKFVLVPKETNEPSEDASSIGRSDSPNSEEDGGAPLSVTDLNFVDVLFCDSIVYNAVKHPRKIRWQLLSDESLAAVKSKAESVTQDLRGFEAERRAAAAKLEAERRAAQEIAIAKQVQARLFPQGQPPLRTLDYAGVCIQAREVGGDYYDFLNLGGERVALVVGDTAGKGIAAALLMANLQASLRSQCAIAVNQPQQMLKLVNRQFFENTAETAYATLFFAEYDNTSRCLRYANCGNLPALLIRDDDNVEWLDSTATVLGLFEQFDCALGERVLSPGDTLALYTDGATESCNSEGEEFGEQRLVESVHRHRKLSAKEVVRAVIDDLKKFNSGDQGDDITLIIAKCKHSLRNS